jgi:hypothetical protein
VDGGFAFSRLTADLAAVERLTRNRCPWPIGSIIQRRAALSNRLAAYPADETGRGLSRSDIAQIL